MAGGGGGAEAGEAEEGERRGWRIDEKCGHKTPLSPPLRLIFIGAGRKKKMRR